MSLLPMLTVFFTLTLVTGAFFGVAVYGDVFIETVVQFWTCTVVPFYETYLEPVVDVIHRFYNPTICWWDGLVMFPYLVGRNVVFPTLLDGGFFQVIVNYAKYSDAIFKDWFVGHISTGAFLTEPLDFTNICFTWQILWISWQELFCFSCNDLCESFVSLPVIPMLFTSSQIGDDQWWVWIDNSLNGLLVFVQEIIRIAYLVFFNYAGSRRPNLRPAFDRFCAACTGFFKSWENALQRTWDQFIPYDFVWQDVLGILESLSCIMLRTNNLMLNLLFHGDLVIDHFSGTNSDYWINVVREDVREIINLAIPSSQFETISVALPGTQPDMVIAEYSLPPDQLGNKVGGMNPVYNKTLASDNQCLTLTRILCDPLNDGTTCQQKFNGTLLENVDICCFGDQMMKAGADSMAFMFEITLHMKTADDFMVFLDRQPFTLQIKTALSASFECLYQIFLVIEGYGFCVQRVLTELTVFSFCMAELTFRTLIAAVTLPYFEVYLPGLDNFLTAPGDQALTEALAFIERIADETDPNGLINCMCFLLNTGFPVSSAGCKGEPPCKPKGFIVPDQPSTRRIDLTLKYGLTPILDIRTGSNVDGSVRARGALAKARDKLTYHNFERLNTMPPTNTSLDCDTCFDLCCFPKKLVVLISHGTTFFYRAINAAFQSRGGEGSPYWTGESCTNGGRDGICFSSDAAEFIGDALAPVTCLCNFISLIIPPNMDIDPCCLFTVLGDAIGCLIQITINLVNSGLNDPEYLYLVDPSMFTKDFDIVIELSRRAVECACDGLRVLFQTVQDATNLSSSFDPCCIPQKTINAIISLLRMAIQLVLVFIPSDFEQECYMYLYAQSDEFPEETSRLNCVKSINDLPIVLDFTDIADMLFAPPGYDVTRQCSSPETNSSIVQDQKVEGLGTCYCSMIQRILKLVFKFVGAESKCPLNICCVIYSAQTFISETAVFAFKLILSLIQNWSIMTRPANNLGFPAVDFDIPEEFIDFFFCNEYADDPQMNVHNIGGNTTTSKCGRLEPAIIALQNTLTDCLCSADPVASPGVGDLVDNILDWLLWYASSREGSILGGIVIGWPRCLCSGGPNEQGMLKPAAKLITVLVRQAIILIRNIPNPTYWNPEGGSLADGDGEYSGTLVDNENDIRKTWIYRFLTPLADALCDFITNSGCLLSMILGNSCEDTRYNLLSSVVRYGLDLGIRVLVLIEGFARLFIQELPGQCVGDPDEVNGVAGMGQATTGNGTLDACGPSSASEVIFNTIDPDQIGSILVSMLSFVVDGTIGIGAYSCTQICPGVTFMQVPMSVPGNLTVESPLDACSCFNQSPYKGGRTVTTTQGACRVGLGLSYNNTVCPGSAMDCSLEEACGNPPGLKVFADEDIDLLLAYPIRQYVTSPTIPYKRPMPFHCKNSVHAGPGPDYLVEYDSGPAPYTGTDHVEATILTMAIGSWGILAKQGIVSSGCTMPVDDPIQNVLDEGIITMEDWVRGQSAKYVMEYPPNQDRPGSSIGLGFELDYGLITTGAFSTVPWAEVTNLGKAGINFRYLKENQFSAGVCELYDQENMTPIIDSDIVEQAVDRLGPGNDPLDLTGYKNSLCTQSFCLAGGYCKNDQMLKCSPGDPRGVLDGVIISAFKYVRCLLTDVVRIPAATFIIDVFMNILSIIWQLSGGIIKLVVSIFVFALRFIMTLNPFEKIGLFFEFIGETFGKFFAIFTQPVIVGVGNRMVRSEGIAMPFEMLLGVHMDGCIDDPIGCICRHRITNECSAADGNYTLAEVLVFMDNVFDGQTECDTLIQHTTATVWETVAYADRFLYIDCIGKRIQGENFNDMASYMPKDFFYSPDGWGKLFYNMVSGTRERMARDHEEKKRHRKKKEITHTLDQYMHQLRLRERHTKRIMMDGNQIKNESPAFDAMLIMDQMWIKYRTGYYGYLRNKIEKKIARDGIDSLFGSYTDNFNNVGVAFNEIYTDVSNLGPPLRTLKKSIVKSTTESWNLVYDVTFNRARVLRDTWFPYRTPREEPKLILKVNPDLYESLGSFTMPSFGIPSISEYVPGLTVNPEVYDRLFTFDSYGWTPEKTYNVEGLQRTFYRIANMIAPDHISRDAHERFVLGGGNCRLVDGTVEQSLIIVDFCLNNFAYNFPNSTNITNPTRRTGHTLRKYGDRVEVEEFKGSNRLRLQLDKEEKHVQLDRYVYRRATAGTSTPTSLGGFNFIRWFICLIEDLFNLDALQSTDEFIQDMIDWFLNTNTDPSTYPDVGAIYYVTFLLRCEFPENVSCQIGIGIEEAFKKIAPIYLLILTVGAFAGFTSLFTMLLSPVIFAVIWGIVAYHWSPACLSLMPSFTMGEGITIPFLPIPLGMWSIPMCLWDDVVSVLNKYITPCLDFLISQSLVNGDICPTCPSSLDFINCSEIGMGDGLTNILYLMYKLFGSGFCTFIIGLSGTFFGRLLPGAQEYLMTVLSSYKNASPSHLERLDFCSVTTIGTIGLPIILLVLLGGFILFIVPAIYGAFVAFIGLFAQTNIYESLVAQAEPTSYDEISGEGQAPEPDDEEEEEPEDTPEYGQDIAGRMTSWFVGSLFKKKKLE